MLTDHLAWEAFSASLNTQQLTEKCSAVRFTLRDLGAFIELEWFTQGMATLVVGNMLEAHLEGLWYLK